MNYQPIGVVMEIVALQDIEEGEEITIDYGSSWKEAWQKHTERFEKKVADGEIESVWPTRASDLNVLLESEPIRTQDEQEVDPYPEGVIVKAFAITDEEEEDDEEEDDDGDGTEADPFHFFELADRTLYTGTQLVEPIILKREDPQEEDGEYTYLIKYPDVAGGGFVYMSGVPQHAFMFVDEPNTGDQFVTEPFRHYIEIPDDIFPAGAWRNLA